MWDLLNDVKFFNPIRYEWISNRMFGDMIENRRNHVTFIVGKFLFIFGGMNAYGKYLSDLLAINLETNKW